MYHCIKLLLLLSIIFKQSPIIAENNHQHHDRTGSHGMVLITDGKQLYASHLPLYSFPHEYQLIYEITTPMDTEIINFLEQAHDLPVTILPDSFDLNRLINGESFSINTSLYKGHFERDGKTWHRKLTVTFQRKLFQRHLALNKPSNTNGSNPNENWSRISLAGKTRMYIHNIQHKPSFDAIVIADSCSQNPQKVTEPENFTESMTLKSFKSCSEPRVLYLETIDFSL